MAYAIGKSDYRTICCTVDMCDDIENHMVDRRDTIYEVYKSKWSIDEDGDIVVQYAYRTTNDGFGFSSSNLNSEEYCELVKGMELIEL